MWSGIPNRHKRHNLSFLVYIRFSITCTLMTQSLSYIQPTVIVGSLIFWPSQVVQCFVLTTLPSLTPLFGSSFLTHPRRISSGSVHMMNLYDMLHLCCKMYRKNVDLSLKYNEEFIHGQCGARDELNARFHCEFPRNQLHCECAGNRQTLLRLLLYCSKTDTS